MDVCGWMSADGVAAYVDVCGGWMSSNDVLLWNVLSNGVECLIVECLIVECLIVECRA
jgi:hypothetical protein